MPSLFVKRPLKQPKYDEYNEDTHHYLRQITSDSSDEGIEISSEPATTEQLIAQESEGYAMSSTIETTISQILETEEMTSYTTAATLSTVHEAIESESSKESGQTILIVLGVLLAILVIVCCVLACIFVRLRRKGFCTMEGKNQETCDDDCAADAMNLQQSPKESMSSGKSVASRSSDKLLTK